jgi:hypothetical protein
MVQSIKWPRGQLFALSRWMKLAKTAAAISILILTLGSVLAHAAEPTPVATQNTAPAWIEGDRMSHRLGFYGSLFGDPWQSELSINAAYQAAPWGRVNVGIGTPFSGTTYGVGMKFMIPGWNLSPVAGFNLNHYEGNPNDVGGAFSDTSPEGAQSKSLDNLSGNLGLDYVGDTGFHFAVGYNKKLIGDAPGEKTALPYLQIGYFFRFP